MLGVGGIAVFRSRRASIAPIGIGALHRWRHKPRSLGCTPDRLFGCRKGYGGCAPRVSPSGWVIAGAIVRDAGGAAGAVVAAVPGSIAVVRAAAIDHGGAVPVAIPTAIAPAESAAHHRAHRDANSKRNHRGPQGGSKRTREPHRDNRKPPWGCTRERRPPADSLVE